MDPNVGDSETMVPMRDKNMGPTWKIWAEQGRRMLKLGEGLLKVAMRQSAAERWYKTAAFFAWKGIACGGYHMEKCGSMVRIRTYKKRKSNTGQ